MPETLTNPTQTNPPQAEVKPPVEQTGEVLVEAEAAEDKSEEEFKF